MPYVNLTVSTAVLQRLKLLAEKSGKSIEDYASDLLTAEMEDGQVNLLRVELLKLREDLALATEAILVTANEVDEKQAVTWVKQRLRHR